MTADSAFSDRTPIRPRVAIALSGGGFRASLFHLGVLRRLTEAGWLADIGAISTVSGGSIIGAFLALRWERLLSAGATPEALEDQVITPFVSIVSSRSFIAEWASGLLSVPFRKLFEPSYSRTQRAAELLGSCFFDGRLCTDLPPSPYLVINSASLISGRAWRFTRDGLGDSRFGYAKWQEAPLGLGVAVGASAAFPPVFTPARIRAHAYHFGKPPYDEEALVAPAYIPLGDGGIYDNLGVEVLTKKTVLPGEVVLDPPQFLVASDAGYPPQTRFRANGLPLLSEGLLLYRVDEIARDQIGALRRRMLVRQFMSIADPLRGVLATLGSSLERIERGASNATNSYLTGEDPRTLIPLHLSRRIQRIRTHLNRFSVVEAEALMYHGYLIADAVLWVNNLNQPAPFRIAAKGRWRIGFTPLKIAEWETALPGHAALHGPPSNE
jgi:NTE family protein